MNRLLISVIGFLSLSVVAVAMALYAMGNLWGHTPRNPCKISLFAFWRAVGLWWMGGKAALPFLAETIGGMVGGCAWGGNGPYFMF